LSGNIEQGTKEPAARLVTLNEHKYSLLSGSHIDYSRENILKEAPAFSGKQLQPECLPS
jgi:hypothetical protein